jgi:hypothetical protein
LQSKRHLNLVATREGSNSAIRVTPSLNQRPLLEEERTTSARAEYFSV